MNCFWEDYQRCRWLRPNAHLYVRPDVSLWRQPNRRLWQAPDFAERKYSPDQPRVPAGNPDGGQWTDGGNAIVLPEIVVSADGTEGDPSDGADADGLIQLAGDIPTGDSPEIPEERPPTSQERTAYLKIAARLLDVGATFAELATVSAWLRTRSAEIESYRDLPKSLEELQQAASTPAAGYDKHHIVERNQEAYFGADVINGPDNLVLVPRLKHQEINGWYQTKNPEFGGKSPRDYLNGRNWDVQRSVGLRALVDAGVLKP